MVKQFDIEYGPKRFRKKLNMDQKVLGRNNKYGPEKVRQFKIRYGLESVRHFRI